MKKSIKNKIINLIILLSCDLIGLVLAFFISYSLRINLFFFKPVQALNEYWFPFMVLLIINILFFLKEGLYRDIRDISMLDEYAKIIKALTYSLLLALALTFFIKLYERSRVLVILYWFLAIGFIIFFRYWFYKLLKKMRTKGWNQLRVTIIGSEKKVKATQKLLAQHSQLGFCVISQVILSSGIARQRASLSKRIHKEILLPYKKGDIDSVIISDTVKNYKYILEIIELLKEHNISHRQITEDFDLTGFDFPEATSDLEETIAKLNEGQIAVGYKVSKRFIDEIIAIITILITLPLWLIIMLAIKLDSKGPVFFKQERIGYRGKKFFIYKFRSMYIHTPHYAKTPKNKADKRVTRIGTWLRRTSLDELPQLINIIKGDMSLVGPRPEMPFIVEKYKPIYRWRLLVLPGLTGLWQISGRSDKPLAENIKYDLYYIKKQSLLLDLIILLRTIPIVILGRGAY